MDRARRSAFMMVLFLAMLAVGCSGSQTQPPAPTSPPASATAVPPTAAPTLAPTFTPIPSTATAPDPCAGAAESGARQKFTFEQIIPCLNTPESLVGFMSSNLKWDGGYDGRTYGDNTYSPAWEVYQTGEDDCDGLAEFGACVLSQNGFEAYNVGISILGPSGHNVTGFVGADGRMYAISNGESAVGPFKSWEELAQYYIDNGAASPADGVIWLFEPCLDQRVTGDPVIDLPHKVVR